MKKIILLLTIVFSTISYANGSIHHSNMQQSMNVQSHLYSLIQASKRGDVKAQYQLATRYRDGDGIKFSFRKAFHLYHQSALKNFAPSQYQLGMMFRHGLGVRTNPELARYWFRKAARNNYAQARDIFKMFYSKKQHIEQHRFTRK